MGAKSFGVRISSVHAGRPAPFGPSGEPSAIHKKPIPGRVAVTVAGLAGDGHGDTVHHGGADKAVHHYAFEHYELWRREYPQAQKHFREPGFFGENLSTAGVVERDVCVGDVYRVGSTILQVSEVRQPCWKLSYRCRLPEFSRRVQETGRTGWYYRVLEPGSLEAGDAMALDDRPHPDWPLSRVLGVLYETPLDRDELQAMTGLAELAAGQRALAERRLETGAVEEWEGRLAGSFEPGENPEYH